MKPGRASISEVKRLHANGLTAEQIAAATGTKRSDVRGLLKLAGLQPTKQKKSRRVSKQVGEHLREVERRAKMREAYRVEHGIAPPLKTGWKPHPDLPAGMMRDDGLYSGHGALIGYDVDAEAEAAE